NGLTKGENLKHADLNTVCHWVLNAWNDISHDIIIRAFKKCSISNCLSGSEDHLIYEDDSKDSDDAESVNNRDENENNNEYEIADYSAIEDSGKDTGEDIGEGSDENTNKKNDFNNWPECFVVI
ncbi:1175_t:CDS:1, partial [Cetraspora pellucida]